MCRCVCGRPTYEHQLFISAMLVLELGLSKDFEYKYKLMEEGLGYIHGAYGDLEGCLTIDQWISL